MYSRKSVTLILVRSKSALLRVTTNCRMLSSIVPFKLADIGEGIAEVELMKWFVKDGDKVKSFDRLCEVQSDKATVEITSRFDGVIAKIHHAEGSIVKVGEALVDIQTTLASDNGKLTSEKRQKESTTGTHTKATPHQSLTIDDDEVNNNQTFATPAVRKIAKENNISLSNIVGTGPKNRVTKEDVLLYLQRGSKSVPSVTISARTTSNAAASPEVGSFEKINNRNLVQSGDQRVAIRGIQRLMVKSMNAAAQVQHLTYCEEVQFNKFKSLRDNLKGELHKRFGIKLSYMPLLIKATSLALIQYPMLNATVNADVTEIVYHSQHNIGVAMDTPKGLIVPVIKSVQSKSIVEIALELNLLQDAASKSTLTETQLSGGTFTLSNIGSVGGTYVVPVLVVPQVVIGAFGRLQVLPRYVDKHGNAASFDLIEKNEAIVRPSMIMNTSWSADHRVVDGATVAKFSNLWKHYVENPDAMTIDLR